ncbi:rRNA processing protein-like protein [Actinidia rufa]|uniref:rRNA processing protein-like protein n=1 Tax=Actinidia rufa TaxID=165716 RepID=A0A7J0ECY7_9ERIC|nr:rRNA processing protein-like protein [Actinidia rufa]
MVMWRKLRVGCWRRRERLRRKAREAKKIAKEVQAQKMKGRTKQKEEEIESVKKWRKQSEFAAGSDKDGEIGLNSEDRKLFERSSKKRPGVAPVDRSRGENYAQLVAINRRSILKEGGKRRWKEEE